jgi:gamma-glutamylcyclotransferase (GGCT)/AIG2-like uncharacterized protein YtfP
MILLIAAMGGCWPYTRKIDTQTGILHSSNSKADSTSASKILKANTKGDSGAEKSLAGLSSAGAESSLSDKQWSTLRAEASNQQAPSKLKPKGDPNETRKVYSVALDLVSKNRDAKALKICHAREKDEWWITLFKEAGGSYDPEIYVWSPMDEELQPYLVVMKKLPYSRLRNHLSAPESGRTCESFELSSIDLADQKVLERAPHALIDVEPKVDSRKNAHPTPSVEPPRKADLKPAPPVKHEEPASIPASTKKNPPGSSPTNRQPASAKNEGAIFSQPMHEPRASATSPDRKPISPFKKTFAQEPEKPETKETVPIAIAGKKEHSVKPTCHVFVYGSSMNHSELMDWLEENGFDESQIIDASPSKLEGYDFVWNYFSPSRGGGTVNLEPKQSTHVYGLLLEIEDGLLRAFDTKEGHPNYYARKYQRVPVKRLEDGKAFFAWLYVANPNKAGKRDVWPTTDYKQKILKAASFWGLPETYMTRIRSWPTR